MILLIQYTTLISLALTYELRSCSIFSNLGILTNFTLVEGEGFDVGQLDVGELALGGVEGAEACEGSGAQRGCYGSRDKEFLHLKNVLINK